MRNCLTKLSDSELLSTAFQADAILKRAQDCGFIASDNELIAQFRKMVRTQSESHSAPALSVCDLIPIEDSDIPIGFYFEENPEDQNEFPADTKEKFWFTLEELTEYLNKRISLLQSPRSFIVSSKTSSVECKRSAFSSSTTAFLEKIPAGWE